MLVERIAAVALAATMILPVSALAQAEAADWHVMQDGVVFGSSTIRRRHAAATSSAFPTGGWACSAARSAARASRSTRC